MTGAQCQAAIVTCTGVALDAQGQTEIAALVATVPVGTTTAIQAARALRLLEIDQVLLIAENRYPPLNTVAAVKTRLGV